ncbi:MAG: glycosyltransferase [Deltaproteobacteria bacterium GWA2_55_10]|nr:MAG: glycosyltransferase [Deltaproteobacteria bacterium GWA2_55_10]
MALGPQKIAILGLSITSSWGNGHATTYRSLVRELSGRGHEVLFLEKDVPWYRENRDLAKPPWCRTGLYSNMEELKDCYEAELREADFVIIGSYVPQGVQVAEWALNAARGATAFYDIDTPVTLAKLCRRDYEYLTPELISRFDLYLSFTGGPILAKIERDYGSPMARPLYCSVDPDFYRPLQMQRKWDIGYIGTYSMDRQGALDELMLEPARRLDGCFVVAGPLYPDTIAWPANTERIDHLPPGQHASFYGSMAFTMNITRADMVRAGYSPSVRLFEAAACATPVISDYWVGLETFFRPGVEILISGSAEETIRYLRETPEEERLKMGERARARVLAGHTAFHRVDELESYMGRVLKKQEVLK